MRWCETALSFSALLLLVPTPISATNPSYGLSAAQEQSDQTTATSSLTNADVLRMVGWGLSPEVIIAGIHRSPTRFDTSPAAVGKLRSAGVPDSVILAMLQASGRSDSTVSTTAVSLNSTLKRSAADAAAARAPVGVQLPVHTVVHPLSDGDVLGMLKAGLAPEVVVAKIKTSPCDFDTSPATLESLKKAGVPSNVVVAMVEAPVTAPASLEPSTRPRVYVTDSESWSIVGWAESHGSISTDAAGNVSGSSNGFGFTRGGARPQTAEIIKTLNQRCPDAIVTDVPGKADYALLLDHEGGKGLLRHKNKVAVFDKAGDSIFTDSTLTLGGSVQGACIAIEQNFAQKLLPH